MTFTKYMVIPVSISPNTDKIKAIDPRELTITFVCSHYPREMLRHLEEMRGITATFQDDGIYYLTGDAIPIQLLITHKLTQDENYWLQNLRTDLKAGRENPGYRCQV